MDRKVAVVTGANKGIGFGIIQGLCEKFQGDVYLTSRDEGRGEKAVKELNENGLHPLYHQLDISDVGSVIKFRDYMKEKHGGIDILINNAAVVYLNVVNTADVIEKTLQVNYFSLLATCDLLFPLLRPNGRVINLTSSLGHLSRIPNPVIRNKFADRGLTKDKLSDLINQYLEDVRRNKQEENGWGQSAYIMSKVAVSALTFIQSREMKDKSVSINCVHPGFVKTDMTSHQGHMTVERGTLAPLYLALEAPQEIKGVYIWHDKSIKDWYGEFPGYF